MKTTIKSSRQIVIVILIVILIGRVGTRLGLRLRQRQRSRTGSTCFSLWTTSPQPKAPSMAEGEAAQVFSVSSSDFLVCQPAACKRPKGVTD